MEEPHPGISAAGAMSSVVESRATPHDPPDEVLGQAATYGTAEIEERTGIEIAARRQQRPLLPQKRRTLACRCTSAPGLRLRGDPVRSTQARFRAMASIRRVSGFARTGGFLSAVRLLEVHDSVRDLLAVNRLDCRDEGTDADRPT